MSQNLVDEPVTLEPLLLEEQIPIKKPYPPFKSILILLGAILVLVIVSSAIIIGSLYTGFISPKELKLNPIPISMYAQTIGYLPVAIYLAYMIPKLSRKSWKEMGLFNPSKETIKTGLLTGLAMLVIVDGLASLQQVALHLNGEEAKSFINEKSTSIFLVIFTFTAAVFAPIIEELVFRNILFRALQQKMAFIPAAVISGIIFAASHANLGSLVPLSIGGFILAYAYNKTGNIWTSIIAHGLFNGMGVAITIFAIRHTTNLHH